jgi:hypothetical protein
MRLVRFAFPVLCAAIATSAIPLKVSDPIGVYALIDRVVFEPDASNPQRVQLWGVFALADLDAGPNSYTTAQRGYLYYSTGSANPRAKTEWSDLESIAGKDQVVGFGGRHDKNGRIRKASEPARDPDAYPRSYVGIVRMPTNNPTANQITRELVSVPLPVTPADGGSVAAGQARLAARSVVATDVKYMFELQRAGGPVEASPEVAAGKGETSWSPKTRLERGQTYTWRVWVVNGGWRGPAASASFRVQ